MRRLALALALALPSLPGCLEAPTPPARAPRTTATHAPRSIETPREAPAPAHETPVASSCPAPAARLQRAKDAIAAFRAQVQELAPVVRFVSAHHCEVKDTSGTALVTRTREAGGSRIAIVQGSENEIVCDVPRSKWPPGLTPGAMATIQLWDDTAEDDLLVGFGAACRDPDLEVTYSDRRKQDQILSR